MALPGETIHLGASPVCPDCKTVLLNDVLRSAAGYYIGTACRCGPYSRESGYFGSYEEARKELASDEWERR